MKKISTAFVSKIIFLLAVFNVGWNYLSAQEGISPLSLGSLQEFKSSFSKVDVLAKKIYVLPIAGNKEVTINIVEKNCSDKNCSVFGRVEGHDQATFFIKSDETKISGKVIFLKTKEAYDIYSNDQLEVFIAPIDINKVICVDYTKHEAGKENLSSLNKLSDNNAILTIPLLNSLPGATGGVIYLDFDGENLTGTGSSWGNINAAPSVFTDADISKIWLAVSEDYISFNVNVSTDRTVYNSTPALKRTMVIFTPTNTASPNAGGVAHLNSFATSGDPCWVFSPYMADAAMCASHESGHTLNLLHDGSSTQAYSPGHDFWGPIMGAAYGQYIVHWSKGDYLNANNQEDDLALIALKIPYRVDDAGNDITTTRSLVLNGGGSGNVAEAANFGNIERNTDKDVFKFTTSGGTVNLTLRSNNEGVINTIVPNLDIQARILGPSANELFRANPTGPISAPVTVSTSLAAGTYYLEIEGVGTGSPTGTGYSDYGSLGRYFISGTIPNLNTTDIHAQENNAAIQIFPNPSTGLLTINVPMEGNNESKIEIVNALGQIVMAASENFVGNIYKEINISTQTSGIYCVIVKSGNDVWQGKVILK